MAQKSLLKLWLLQPQEDKEPVTVAVQPQEEKARSENVLEAAARKRDNETGDLLKKFTGTATGDLPIFQMDEYVLTMPPPEVLPESSLSCAARTEKEKIR